MEITSIASFLDYWQKIHARTLRVVRVIPPERIEWSYREGKFTLGDLVRHLAALERFMFAENVAGRPSSYPGHGRELADGHDAVVRYFETMNAETVAELRRLPDARLVETCVTPGGAELQVWKWLRAMVEHHVHHRGQIYLSLGMLGVATPPLYGLTSEEVRERSTPSAAG
ncbi:MAG: DinB family protein [Thermoanaerobaculia bacterium]|nr:DinB family protein [Thermoanaerobaculia bacterium]